MREEIRSLQQRMQLTVAYVTHDQAEALAVSDQIIVMNAGLIAQAGTPKQLYQRPQSEFVAGFMGEAMLFERQADSAGCVRLGPLLLQQTAPAAGTMKIAVRPEAWRVVAAGQPGALPATLLKRAYLGSCQALTVASELGEIPVVSPVTTGAWQTGQALGLLLADSGVCVRAAG